MSTTTLARLSGLALIAAFARSVAGGVLQGAGGTALMLGLLLLGIGIVRSRVFPRWTGALMAVAPILLLAPVPETPVVTGLPIELPRGLAVAAMGWVLFAQGSDERDAIAGAAAAQLGVVATR